MPLTCLTCINNFTICFTRKATVSSQSSARCRPYLPNRIFCHPSLSPVLSKHISSMVFFQKHKNLQDMHTYSFLYMLKVIREKLSPEKGLILQYQEDSETFLVKYLNSEAIKKMLHTYKNNF